jgi:subtilisin family serine protease
MHFYKKLQNLMFLSGMWTRILIVMIGISLTAAPACALDLNGTYIKLGINSDGSLINDARTIGAQFPDSPSIEFFIPGTPYEGWAVGVDGSAFRANFAPSSTAQIPVIVIDTSAGSIKSALVTGTVDFGSGQSLAIKRTIAFSVNGTSVIFGIELTNTGTATLTKVAFLEGGDPDQGYALISDYTTHNDVVFDGQFVRAWASGGSFPSGLTVGLGTCDLRCVLSVESPWQMNPYEILNSPVDPNDSLNDAEICLAFDFGTLGVGQTVSAEYHMIFGRTVSEADNKFKEICPPDNLSVTPQEGFSSIGDQGGWPEPFKPTSKDYTLTNVDINSLNWTVITTQSWLNADPNSGTLGPGDSNTVTVSLTSDVNTLPPGNYNDIITFTNVTSGISQTRQATLSVLAVPGEIDVTDSIPPPDDLNMPFGELITGLSRTERITITNTSPIHELTITDISLGRGYLEDFNDGLAQDWQEDIDADWQVIDGQYKAYKSSPASTESMVSTYSGEEYDNLTLETKFKRDTSSGYAQYLLFRATANFERAPTAIGSAYGFGIDEGAYYIYKQVSGVFTTLVSWTDSPYLNMPPLWNTLMVVADGPHLSFYINGHLVNSLTDSSLTSGRIGLLGYTGTSYTPFNSHFYDNVFVGEVGTVSTCISQSQQWYNEHSFQGGTPEDAPKNWQPPQYFGDDTGDYSADSAIWDILSTDGFQLENVPTLPAVILPSEHIDVNVIFEPTEVKEYESFVVIDSNDRDESEVKVLLSGTGIADYLEITPDVNFTFAGHPGGPFVPTLQWYELRNIGPYDIDWIVAGPNWLDISPAGGNLQVGYSTTVNIWPNHNATLLPRGIYDANLAFTNTTTGKILIRNIILNVRTDPKVWTDPHLFNVTARQDEDFITKLTIGNTGDADLEFNLVGTGLNYTPAREKGGEPLTLKLDKEYLSSLEQHNFVVPENALYVEGELLVRFAPDDNGVLPTSQQKDSIISYSLGALQQRQYKIVPGLSLVKLPPGITVKEALATLSKDASILYAQPNYEYHTLITIPNDPRFNELWGMHNTGQTGGTPGADINAPEAWDIATGTGSIVVAVIDTGVDYNHPDISDNMWINEPEFTGKPGVDDDGNGYIDDIYGYDFVNNDGDPIDDYYHGTHCAGTIGAVGNNAIGVTGVCWSLKIMAVKFLDSSGSGSTADAISSVQYAMDMGARIMSNSWGGGSYDIGLKDAIDAAGRAGIVFVAAAGNDNVNNDTYPHYPSSYDSENIIAVMATDKYDAKASYSNYGPISVDIGAPGSEILSTFPTYTTTAMAQKGYSTYYETINGTSMATPHVSGACALLLSVNPGLEYKQLKDILIQTVDTTLPGLCVSNGRMNLHRALGNIKPASWLSFEPDSGTIGSDQSQDVNVIFDTNQPPGMYEGEITVYSNDPFTRELAIPIRINLLPYDYFTELFEPNDPWDPNDPHANDMDNTSIVFRPDSMENYRIVCRQQAAGFPEDPNGSIVVPLNDDDYEIVDLNDTSVMLYGEKYNKFYIGSNGYISFISGDTAYLESLEQHFYLPRISALFDDLNPSAGGQISYKILSDKVVVTFENISEYSLGNSNSFQVEMWFDGKIRITWLRIDAHDGLVGLSDGLGLPLWFSQSDFSEYSLCNFATDLNGDLDTDLLDFAKLALHWCESGQITIETVADQFNFVSYSGNDGSQNWSNDWLEIGESDGPSAGNVRVVNSVESYALRIGRSIKGRGLAREVDLSSATFAILTLDWWRGGSYYSNNTTVDISGDGGATWTTLLIIPDGYNTGMHGESFDISTYIAPDTRIRFITNDQGTGYIYFDNIQIEYDLASMKDPWCNQCDLNHDLKIDFLDLKILAEHWLE